MAEHQSLAAALAAFHAEAPKIVKDSIGKVNTEKAKYTYGYADLAQVTEALNPALGKHGLSFIAKPTMTSEGFGLVYKLKHESGDEEEGFWPLPDPRNIKPQDLGSFLTYWRRYAFMSITNTFPSGEDDDGAQAQSRDSWDTARPRQDQPVSAPPAPKTSWSDEEVVKLVKPMPTATISKAIDVYDWMVGKDLHNRVVKLDYQGNAVAVTAMNLIAGRIADEALGDTATVEKIKGLQKVANERKLMQVQVSDTETLAEALHAAQELAAHAAAEQGTQERPNTEQGA